MSSNDLFERRATRGSARGAARVWTEAQPHAEVKPNFGWSAALLRVALVGWIVGFGVIGLTILDQDAGSSALDAAQDPEESPSLESDEPLPQPILVDGMSLRMVSRPFDPGFDGDDILDDLGFTRSPDSLAEIDSEHSSRQSVIFANPEDPFNGPIIGLELFGGGGFRPWSANTDTKSLEEFTAQLIQQDGAWTIAPESGLVEVARFSGDVYDNLKLGWQFDFGESDQQLTLQAESSGGPEPASIWVWVNRLLSDGPSDAVISEVEVIGNRGMKLDYGPSLDTDEVIWADSSGFVYRLTAATISGNTSLQMTASDDAERLRVVSRTAWVNAVNEAERTPPVAIVGSVLGAVVVLGLLASLGYFLIRRVARPAVIAAASLVGFYVFGSSGLGGGLSLLTLGFSSAGLALAWWAYRESEVEAGES